MRIGVVSELARKVPCAKLDPSHDHVYLTTARSSEDLVPFSVKRVRGSETVLSPPAFDLGGAFVSVKEIL
jgi:hypothetical protein